MTVSWTAVTVILGSVLAGIYMRKTSIAKSQKYYSQSYVEARQKFRNLVQEKGLEHYVLKVTEEDHTIDMAIAKGDDRLVIHISGTHGVEGFAGSAVQSAFLDKFTASKDKPTILFIHALNPFGFDQLRRWNENGIDLNRNAFFDPLEFDNQRQKDPNRFHYVDFCHFLNPSSKLGLFDFFWVKAIYFIARHGFWNVKKAIVSGNYHFKDSLFFGGFELQKSHILIKEFIENHFDITAIKSIAVIDVHTGLGPKGFDTIQLHQNTLNRSVFGDQKHIVEKDLGTSALGGYEDVAGGITDALISLFPNAKQTCVATQEFGTVPGISVVKALRAELAAYRHDKENWLKYAKDVRDVFYLDNDTFWKDKVVERGTFLLQQVYSNL
jgi:hypothetical protein